MRFVSCSFHIIYKWLHRNWKHYLYKILWRHSDCRFVKLHPTLYRRSWKIYDMVQSTLFSPQRGKNKGITIDFRKQPPAVSPITINSEIVERVEKYKYLGIILDNQLKFDSNVLNTYKKCHYRIDCLQRLRNIGINSKILALYYQ